MSTRLISCLTNPVLSEPARNRPEDDLESFLLVLAYALMRNVLESKRDLGLEAESARAAFEARFSAAASANLHSLRSVNLGFIFQNLSVFKAGLDPVLYKWAQDFGKNVTSKHTADDNLVDWSYYSISHDALLGYLDDAITQLSKAQTPNPISASTLSRT